MLELLCLRGFVNCADAGVNSLIVHIVIMGCGRVGSTLARDFQALGHSVAVIDQDREAFRRLGADFNGLTVAGIGFDRDTLIEAGIQRADAFAAVSDGDNSNILAARVARETYGVKNVVARIYDPGRAEIYQRLGIPTVATVLWTTDQIMRRILPTGAKSQWQDASGRIQLVESSLHSGWFGNQVLSIERLTKARVAFVTRLGEGLIPDEHSVLQEGDVVHLLVTEENLKNVDEALRNSPGEQR
ncbi:MAG TPA: TrkA family potassium uptake protein [Candidatus Nanopelagicaceae bacterium]